MTTLIHSFSRQTALVTAAQKNRPELGAEHGVVYQNRSDIIAGNRHIIGFKPFLQFPDFVPGNRLFHFIFLEQRVMITAYFIGQGKYIPAVQ